MKIRRPARAENTRATADSIAALAFKPEPYRKQDRR
jgi:hypothetical protein